MKKLVTLFALLACVGVCTSSAQTSHWQFSRVFTDVGSVTHGCAVAPDGKIWVVFYNSSEDPVGIGPYTPAQMRSIRVFNPDGTVATLIQTLTIGSVTDTLTNVAPSKAGRGIFRAKNGDMLYSTENFLYRINSSTYAGIAKYQSTFTPGQAGETDDGDIILPPILPGNPVVLLTSGLSYVGNLVDATTQTSRGIAVTPDGKHIYYGPADGPGVLDYYSPDGVLGTYTVAGTLLPGVVGGSLGWRNGKLWIGSDKASHSDNLVADVWYEIDPVTQARTDILNWNTTANRNCWTRGIDFSLGKDTAYVVGAEGNAVQMFVHTTVGVEPTTGIVPEQYSLSENYPNPFNPSTQIEFSIPKGGYTTLRVYDVLGKEVATLVQESLSPGTYRSTFNGSALASGTYIYRLVSNGMVLTKKMELVK